MILDRYSKIFMQRMIKISVGLCLIAIFVSNALTFHSMAFAESEVRIAVVPKFRNLSGFKELDKWIEAIPEMLHKGLINSPGIKVVERKDLMKVIEEVAIAQKIEDIIDLKTVAKIGEGVGANFVVTGSFIEDEGKIRIDVRLVEVEKLVSIVAESLICEKRELLTQIDMLAPKLAEQVISKISPIPTEETKDTSIEKGSPTIKEELPLERGEEKFRGKYWIGEHPSSPVIFDELVYVTDGEGGIYALNADRCWVKWRSSEEFYISSQPCVLNNTLYASGIYYLYALDKDTGSEKWKNWVAVEASKVSGVKDVIYVSSIMGVLYAFDANSGEILWRYENPTNRLLDKLLDKGYKLSFLGTLLGTMMPGWGKISWGIIGLMAWKNPEPNDAHIDDYAWTEVVSRGGLVYVGSEDGKVYKLKPGSYTASYKGEYKVRGKVEFSPVIKDDVLYYGSNYGWVYAIDLESDLEKWRYKIEGRLKSSPAVDDGRMYICSKEGYIYAIDTETGTLTWKSKPGGKIESSPVVANGVVYVGSKDNHIYAIDAETGLVRWKYKTGGEIIESPAIGNGFVYICSEDGYLYLFDEKEMEMIDGDKLIMTGKLHISSQPPGATVWIDDAKVPKKTPVEISGLARGEHKVKIDHSKLYEIWCKKIDIRDGKPIKLNPELTKRYSTSLPVESIPQADIYVNGKYKGKTPHTVSDLYPGTILSIRLCRPGYKDEKIKYVHEKGENEIKIIRRLMEKSIEEIAGRMTVSPFKMRLTPGRIIGWNKENIGNGKVRGEPEYISSSKEYLSLPFFSIYGSKRFSIMLRIGIQGGFDLFSSEGLFSNELSFIRYSVGPRLYLSDKLLLDLSWESGYTNKTYSPLDKVSIRNTPSYITVKALLKARPQILFYPHVGYLVNYSLKGNLIEGEDPSGNPILSDSTYYRFNLEEGYKIGGEVKYLLSNDLSVDLYYSYNKAKDRDNTEIKESCHTFSVAFNLFKPLQ